jgi:hypothetical protein
VNSKAALTFILLISQMPLLTRGQLVINEFMSKNETSIVDVDGDHSDWIEIFNTGVIPINLEGFSLSDKAEYEEAWFFPNLVIEPNGFLLVFASDKDSVINGEIHTDFKIKSLGESIRLSNANNQVLDQMTAEGLEADKTFGRITDGSSIVDNLEIPTPGTTNASSLSVSCSHPSGHYSDSICVTLASSDTSTLIRYTLTGNSPNWTSPIYTKALTFGDVSDRENSVSNIALTPLEGPDPLPRFIWNEPNRVYKANVLRFALFDGNTRLSRIHSKTFFIDPEFDQRYSFPVLSLVTDSLGLFDHDTGIMVPGLAFENSGFDWLPAGNYHHTGPQWERQAHFSFFSKEGTLGFESNVGIRIRGWGSAVYPQKSLNIYFRSEYGKSKISYPIFDTSGLDTFKRLTLRNSGNDFLLTHFRDAVLQSVLDSMNLELQRFKPSILFINGEYWGIQNIREKYDQHYLRYNLDVNEVDLTIVNACGEYEFGSTIPYFQLSDFISDNDLSIKSNYDSVTSLVDIENLIQYEIAEIFFANVDWPLNNFKHWKAGNHNSKWRYLIYDLDHSFAYSGRESYEFESLPHSVKDDYEDPELNCSNMLFKALLKNESFKSRFINAFAHHLNTTFQPNRIIKKINAFESLYQPEIQEHIERWGYPESVEKWENHIEDMRSFARKRPCFMKEHILSFFHLDEINVNCDSTTAESIEWNIFPNPSNGEMVTIELKTTNSDNWLINLHSITGQKLININLNNQKGILNLHNLNSGVYLIVAKSDGQTFREKLIISR